MTTKKLIFFIAILLVLAVILLGLPESLIAQTPPPPPSKPAQAPIDGGIGILAAAGGTYAIKKLRDRKNNPPA